MLIRFKVALLASIFLANFANADLPIFSEKPPLTMVSYDDNIEGSQGGIEQIFFSSGKYCFITAGGGGGVALVGKWRYTTPTQITVVFDPFPNAMMKNDDGFLASFKPIYQIEGSNVVMMNADNRSQIYTTFSSDDFKKEKFDPTLSLHQQSFIFCQTTNEF